MNGWPRDRIHGRSVTWRATSYREGQALIAAAKRGVLVVQCSRAGSGRVIQRSEDREAGFVAADNLNPQKARVLAMLALCRTNDRVAITRMFIEY